MTDISFRQKFEARGNKASLPPEEREFLDFCAALRDFHKRNPCYFKPSIRACPDKARLDLLVIDARPLKKIDYEEVIDPNSEGMLTFSFWRADTGHFFLRVHGHGDSGRDELFGPFKKAGRKFELVKM